MILLFCQTCIQGGHTCSCQLGICVIFPRLLLLWWAAFVPLLTGVAMY